MKPSWIQFDNDPGDGSALFRDWKRIETGAIDRIADEILVQRCSAIGSGLKLDDTERGLAGIGSALFRDWKRIETIRQME